MAKSQATREGDGHEAIWRALASRWRRRMLDLLQRHPRTTNEVWAALGAEGLSRFAVMQHLRVLERAGLVMKRHSGRTSYNVLHPTPLKRIYRDWIRRYLTLKPAPVISSAPPWRRGSPGSPHRTPPKP